jgi:1-pyrroline-5-carboxylate dehydrogenase
MAIAAIPSNIKPRTPQGAFLNESFTNFNDPENARAIHHALDQVAARLGSEYPMIIGGKRIKTAERIHSINPARPAQIVGIHQKAGAAEADTAMSAALRAFDSWSKVPVDERASLLLNASDIIRKRKFEFMAWLTYEVGKNWAEADADVGETIDFLEFYAREALRLAAATTPIQYPGERNELLYIPLGVGAVIPPWNFPFAIMAGMTAAAIVTGNTVILKPSSDAPTIAARFVEVLEEAGMPDGVVNFCPGSGATFGNAIVEHPKTRFIAFTGSRPVGLEIHRRAAQPRPGQIWIKRTILEMGGKDSILVSDDADLDAAVQGVVASAFGFSGQKCSRHHRSAPI